MTEPVSAIPVDDTIAAIRIVRGINEGEPGPWPAPVTAIRGLAVMLIGVLRAMAELHGITDDGLQVRYVREWLDDVHMRATLTAVERGARDGEEPAAEGPPAAVESMTAAGTAEACGILIDILDGAPGPVLVRPATLRALCLAAITAAKAVVTTAGADDEAADEFARGWLGSVRDDALRLAAAGA